MRDAQMMSGGDTFLNWQMPLHSGSAFGLTGRVIISLSGLIFPAGDHRHTDLAEKTQKQGSQGRPQETRHNCCRTPTDSTRLKRQTNYFLIK